MLVKNDSGGIMRIVMNADTPYQAHQMAKSIYGSNMISESANLVY